MKTITIDFDEYKKELLRERRIGFELVRELKPKLGELVRSLEHPYSSDDYEKAKRTVILIYKDLNELDLGPTND